MASLGDWIGFGSAYWLITWITRRRLALGNSERIAYAHTQMVKALQEGLGGIRDVLLDGTQPVYCDIYSKADRALRRANGNTIFVSGSPRFAMEALGMVLIAALAYVGISRKCGRSREPLFPCPRRLSVGCAAPASGVLQQGYNSWAEHCR